MKYDEWNSIILIKYIKVDKKWILILNIIRI